MIKIKWMPCFLLFLLSTVMLTGCVGKVQHRSSSVVQYLYPKQQTIVESPSIPHLTLPLRVGIAFVPVVSHADALTEVDKMTLMQQVSQHFKKYDFVKSIRLIPSAYLRPSGSFANLDQIQTMHGVDVMALISYDQTQFTDNGWASISYWTLIGAYIIPGEKNDTHTMLDATLYDIKSRNMLFRAPGLHHLKSRATLINVSEQLRLDRVTSFQAASVDLIKNLDIQLALFKARVQEQPEAYQISHRPGYTGGGRVDRFLIFLLALLAAYGLGYQRFHRM